MGFFSKIGKGIKSAFKSIGKGIKSAFKRFGKFMNKIGVLGQIAMMFILPGVGNMLASAWSGIAGQTAGQAAAAAAGQAAATGAAATGSSAAAATSIGASAAADVTRTIAAGSVKGASAQAVAAKTLALGSSAPTGLMAGGNFAQGVGKLMQFTGKVVGTPGRVFSNITQGVTETLGNFAKTASNNIFGSSFTTAAGDTLSGKFFSGGDSAFGRSFGSTSKFSNVLAKSPTIATKQAASQFQATVDSLAKLPQSSLNTEGLPNNMSLRQDPAFKLQEKTFGRRGNTMNVGEGIEDFSKPVKDFDAAKFSGDGVGGIPTEGAGSFAADRANPEYYQREVVDNALADSVSTVTNADNAFRNANALRKNQFRSSILENATEVRPLENIESLIPDDLQASFKRMNQNRDGTFGNQNVINTVDASNTVEAATSGVEEVVKPSLLENIKTGITGAPKRIMDKATDIAKDPLGYAFKGFEESIKKGIQYKAKEALGLTPDMPDQSVTYSRAYVPTFDTGGGAGSYQAPETMNARAFEQNVLSAPNQYGYTAFQYDQYMNRTAQA